MAETNLTKENDTLIEMEKLTDLILEKASESEQEKQSVQVAYVRCGKDKEKVKQLVDEVTE